MRGKSEEYDSIARDIFLPIFPLIAKEALDVYGGDTGKCLDIGSGGGMFGYFVALLSDMQVTFLDMSADAIETARKRGLDWGLDDRCDYIVSDVHDMSSVADKSYDLIVSRGSLPFWGEDEEFIKAFREIDRIIAPGGAALIGGSLGTPRMRSAISARMIKEKNADWKPPESKEGDCVSGYEKRAAMLNEAGIKCEAMVTERGHWILIRK